MNGNYLLHCGLFRDELMKELIYFNEASSRQRREEEKHVCRV